MRLVTKIAAGVLLGIGLPISVMAIWQIASPNVSAEDKSGSEAALVLFGLPPAVLGSWLIWNGRRLSRQELSDRLQATFFRLLQEHNGHLTALQFAMETGLNGEAARAFLDERAKEFNAGFNVTEEGKLSYYFDLGQSIAGTLPAASETYDVLVTNIPAQQQRQVVKVVKELTGLEWQQAKQLVRRLPEPILIRSGVSRIAAADYRQRLEASGAEVLVVLK